MAHWFQPCPCHLYLHAPVLVQMCHWLPCRASEDSDRSVFWMLRVPPQPQELSFAKGVSDKACPVLRGNATISPAGADEELTLRAGSWCPPLPAMQLPTISGSAPQCPALTSLVSQCSQPSFPVTAPSTTVALYTGSNSIAWLAPLVIQELPPFTHTILLLCAALMLCAGVLSGWPSLAWML